MILSILLIQQALAQSSFLSEIDGDMEVSSGGDIFTDFNEDLEQTQILEDERFYRYGRFFTVNIGFGSTGFTGNRGAAYNNNNPSYHLSMTYFFNFQSALVLGLEYSKHTMFIDTQTVSYGFRLGAVEVNMLRPFFGLRYYIDTTNLGTAITYSNPYFVGRMEYWYQTNKFVEQDQVEDLSGGGIGTGLGFGLEFPLEIKKSYVNVEFLYHQVNYFDKYTQDYRQDPNNPDSTFGYDDLTGNAYSVMVNYVSSW